MLTHVDGVTYLYAAKVERTKQTAFDAVDPVMSFANVHLHSLQMLFNAKQMKPNVIRVSLSI